MAIRLLARIPVVSARLRGRAPPPAAVGVVCL